MAWNDRAEGIGLTKEDKKFLHSNMRFSFCMELLVHQKA